LTDPSSFALGVGILALAVVAVLTAFVLSQDTGTDRMRQVARYISIGTSAYLGRQVRAIALFIPLLAVAILLAFGWKTSLAFLAGVSLSLLAGYVGISIAIRSNVRTASAAAKSSWGPLRLAFMGGAVTGLSVTALSLIGLFTLRLGLDDLRALVGFGFGGSLAALFAQIGGGIYTKSADVGADLVGKVEEAIPEDDPRNAAVIADLVGDNVGDCAGRGSDLFQSFSDDIVTGMILGSAFVWKYGSAAVVFPLVMQGMGILASLLGIAMVREWRGLGPSRSLLLGLLTSASASTIGLYVISDLLMNDVTIFLSGLSGIVAMLIAIFVTEYYTGLGNRPVRQIAKISRGGAAINIIAGLSYGLQSSILPVLAVISAIVFSYIVSGQSLYAIVMANIGTDLMTAFIMSSDAFGPIVDNAHGIVQMSGASPEAKRNLEFLDAVGNTMKASTKAYAMASGTITAFVIFATYFQTAGISSFPLTNPFSLASLFAGVTLPFLFSSFTVGATATGAFRMVDEVRRQFREIPGLREGRATPDYAKCVDVATGVALQEMVIPGVMAFVTPTVVGLVAGREALGALIVGAVASSALLGFFFNNVGATFDNAKKFIETYGEVGSQDHRAAVVGDTVGDPLKDVAGPSLLIFMKLLGMTSLLLLPLLM